VLDSAGLAAGFEVVAGEAAGEVAELELSEVLGVADVEVPRESLR
jgi:hypothetical protein